MKFFKIPVLILFLFCMPASAIEEVVLEKESLNLNRLSDIYYGNVEDNRDINPVFKLFSEKGIEFENSKINSIKADFFYSGQLNYLYSPHTQQYFKHDFENVEPTIIINFNDNKSKAVFNINFTRHIPGHSNWFTQRISQIYVSHKITENQTITFGQAKRLPSTIDGSLGLLELDTVMRSQIGRTLGNVRSMGIRNTGKYKYLDYDIGVYDSTRYMKHFGNGVDFTGHISLKPLAGFESEVLNNVVLGAGYNIGQNNISYNMYSLFAGYNYDKVHFKIEYANADGYNALVESQNKSDGFYSELSYDIHPKITLVTRYDFFNYDKNYAGNRIKEYTAGITYKPFKNMKLMLNYVRRDCDNTSDSNMILFATRFFI